MATDALGRMVEAACALALLLATAPMAASAQGADDPWVRAYYNLERSHIDHPFGRGLIFEAQIAPQLVVAQSVHALFAEGRAVRDGASHWAYSLSVSPMVRLRMIDDASQPVRTPSYMPHLVAQLFRIRNRSRAARESKRLAGPYEMITLQARLSHHSNGQDGCLYTTQVKRPTGPKRFECTFLPGYGPDPAAINRLDGSFSKNFVRGGVFYRRLYVPAGGDRVRTTWYAGATIETHHSFLVNWIPGRIPDDQRALYGSWSWRALAGLARRAGGRRWEGGHFLDVTYQRYPDASSRIPRWSLSIEYARNFRRFGGWGVYARYFYGQDYYNLGFGRRLKRFSLGLAWLQDRFQRVGAPSF